MADRISEFAAVSQVAGNDLVPLVDVSDTTQAPSGTTKRTTRDGLLAGAALPIIPTIEGSGHSWMFGTPTPQQGYFRKLAAMMGCSRVRSFALAGAIASHEDTNGGGDGGFTRTLQGVTRPSAKPPKLMPRSQLVVLNFGINDKAVFGPTDGPFKEAMTTMARRYRAVYVAEAYDGAATHSSIALGGTAGVFGYTAASGSGAIGIDATGEKVTITVPSWFDGRDIDLGFIINNAVDGVASLKIDGVSQANISLPQTLANAGATNNSVVRTLSGLAPGAHTIEVGWVSGFVFFNYWQLSALSTEGPLIVFMQPPKFPDYSPYAGWAYPLNDTRIGEIKTAIDTVAAGIPHSLTVNLDATTLSNNADLFDATAHPNEAGMSVTAQAIFRAIQASGWVDDTLASLPVDFAPHFQPVAPATAPSDRVRFTGTWVNFGGGTLYDAGYRLSDDGAYVELRGVVKSGTINTALMTLPPGHRPKRTLIFVVNSNNAFGRLEVSPAGVVTPTVGNNTYVVLDGIRFQAEQ